MNNRMLLAYKPVGLTPLQAIYKLKEVLPRYNDAKISYAGRLDPMAEGLLIFLVNDANKKRHEYEDMEKAYEFEVLYGVSTDTYDILGLITSDKLPEKTDIERNVLKVIPELLGKQMQPFPPYSSKPVNGKPLYWWARQNRLSEITIPERSIDIYEINHLSTFLIPSETLEENIKERINLVEGDFRQGAILSNWKDFLDKNKQTEFCVMKFSVRCSSGTYIRSLAKKMGEKIGIPALALSIKRTHVGEYKLSNSINLS